MLRNYLKTTLRAMRRQAGYASLNIIGLALGLTATLFVVLWVQDEQSFDRDFDQVESIYRVMRHADHGPQNISTTPSITAKLDEVLVRDYPEIVMGALQTWEQDLAFARDDITFRDRGVHAGPDYLRIFSHTFLAGDPAIALQEPVSIVLTEGMARRYFPNVFPGAAGSQSERVAAAQSVVGETIRLDDRIDLTVTGIIEDVPANRSTRFEYVIAMEEYSRRNGWMDNWNNNGARMFVTLREGADHKVVSEKIRSVIKDHSEGAISDVFLQPYTDVYLKSRFENGALVGGRIDSVRLFALVGLFIFLIAAINFTNLATARSAQRGLETGIRRVFGGSRASLAARFLVESVTTALLALGVAIVAVWLLLPTFNDLTGKTIALRVSDMSQWLRFVGIALGLGFCAGLYPAVYLSGANLVAAVKGGAHGAAGMTGPLRAGSLRKGLVVFQFSVSIILIAATITVYRQLGYIQDRNLGLDRESVFYSELEGRAFDQIDAFRARLLEGPGIASVSQASETPIDVNISTGGAEWDGKDPNDRTAYYVVSTGYDFVETMDIELASGRTFSPAFGGDSANVLINEAAAQAMGMEVPVGQRLSLWDRDGEIVGVVKDFHMRSMHEEIQPLIVRLDPDQSSYVFVRARAGQTAQALATFERAFREFSPAHPFGFTFLDEDFDAAYKSESIIGRLGSFFAVFAIVVACLGLFGLAAFTAERRAKEIGIRKVLGSSVLQVVALLSGDLLRLVVLGFVIGSPVAYLLMRDWLSDFAYHIDLQPGIFVAAGFVMLLIALAAVGYQAVRAALANPVEAIRAT